jgi:hypothetical protein
MRFLLLTKAFWAVWIVASLSSACLTIRQRILNPDLPPAPSGLPTTSIFIHFHLQDLSDTGRRTEYPQLGQPHEMFHEYLIDAFEGQGFEVIKDAQSAEVILEAKLTRRVDDCRYAGFAMSCANMEIAQLLTLSLLPITMTETDILESQVVSGKKVIATLTHEDAYDTWIHLLLLPLAPIEMFRWSHLSNIKDIMAVHAREAAMKLREWTSEKNLPVTRIL